MTDTPKEKVGYKNPPIHSRIKPGERRNPKGRTKGVHKPVPYAFLDEVMTIRENGVERQVTAAEAFLLKQLQGGLKGDVSSQKLMREAIERRKRIKGVFTERMRPYISFPKPGDPERIMTPLGMTTRLDRFGPAARVRVEPWLVELALSRLGDRRLTPEEQARIVKSTRTPTKVNWPAWWVAKP